MPSHKSPLSSGPVARSAPNKPLQSNPEKKGKHARKNANKKKLQQSVNNAEGKPQQSAPIKLNRRMRKLQREAEIKALEGQTVAQFRPAQENLSCNWKLLQTVLDKDKPRKPDHNTKKGAVSSIKKAKAKTTSSPLVTSVPPPTDPEDVAKEAEFTAALIDSLAKEESPKSRNGKPIAWFNGVDPVLLDDDVAVDSDTLSNGEDSEPEGDPIEVDMDAVDNYFDNAKKKEDKRILKKQNEKVQQRLQLPIALDCEMVGVGVGGSDSAVARVSLVDKLGNTVYDKYVKPVEPVTDYRTKISGIRPEHLVNATEFLQVQLEVSNLIKGKLLVGHAIKNDLSCLMISHPNHYIRDTTTFPGFRTKYSGTPSLKRLCKDFLGVTIQEGEHDSVADAQATMQLYLQVREEWETYLLTASRANIKKMSQTLKLVNCNWNGKNRRQKKRTNNGRITKLKKKNKKFAGDNIKKKMGFA